MADLELELKDLRDKNNELVQKVQYWKITAAQKENEKLELMKEVTELRLKLSRLRNGGATHAQKLDAALQTTSEEALSHLVQASSAVARTLELVKSYMQDRQELDSALPRWSNLSESHSSKKINKVRPMLIGGRSVQPLVLLDRTLQSSSNPVNTSHNSQNRSVTERALPMHMLLDVYIPLRRIDANDLPASNEVVDMEVNDGDVMDDSVEGLGLDESDERILDDQQNILEEFDESRGLGTVAEDLEPEGDELTPPRAQPENPLEGPSWLLDRQHTRLSNTRSRINHEPDSTTEFEDNLPASHASSPTLQFTAQRYTTPATQLRHSRQMSHAGTSVQEGSGGSARSSGQTGQTGQLGSTSMPRVIAERTASGHTGSGSSRTSGQIRASGQAGSVGQSGSSGQLGSAAGGSSLVPPVGQCEFSPTVRRRKRVTTPPPTPPTSRSPRPSPHFSPRPARRFSNNGRILKVLVAKMRLDDDDGGGGDSPARRTPPQWPRGPLKRPAASPAAARGDAPGDARAEGDGSPPKRPLRFDAPSPNGATDARVIVFESPCRQPEPCGSGLAQAKPPGRGRRLHSYDSNGTSVGDSDSSGEMLVDRRPRRQKKTVVYKEKPLNRKLRR